VKVGVLARVHSYLSRYAYLEKIWCILGDNNGSQQPDIDFLATASPGKQSICKYCVLGSARTGLIFTGLTQPSPGQTEQGILYHVPHAGFRWGRAARRELTHGSGACGGGRGGRLSGSCGLCCAFLLICIIVVTVLFVCCSVKLPLSRPTGFCLFLSILLRTPAGGGAAAWHFCCRLQLNQNTL